MFSPDAAVFVSASARNPRRRQRIGSEDSVALQHHPKRIRRSILSPETFQPLEDTKRNGHIAHVAEEPALNGHVREHGNQRHASVDATSLAIRHRGIKKVDRERKTSKHDGSFELASGSCGKILFPKSLTFCKTDQERELHCDPITHNTRTAAGSWYIRSAASYHPYSLSPN